MRINVNLQSLNVYRAYSKALQGQSVAMDRVSTGVKVKSAKDDPNALSKSESTRIQIRGLQMASKNLQDSVSMMQTCEGALDNVTSMLQRMKELTVKAGNGTNSDYDKAIIENEIDSLTEGIGEVLNNGAFNEVNLISGKDKNLSLVYGANSDEQVELPYLDGICFNGNSIEDLKKGGSLDVTKDGNVEKALGFLEGAIEEVMSKRSEFGSISNRFESTYENTIETSDKMEGAVSNIVDTDVAEEILQVSKYNVLVEAGNAMMVQTNNLPKDALRILENLRAR